MLTWRCQPCEEKAGASVVPRRQQKTVPRGAPDAFGKIARVGAPAGMALQKIVHLVSPLACDDRTDGIEKFAPRSHQIGTYIGEARLIGDVATQPRGGKTPAQFGTAHPSPASSAERRVGKGGSRMGRYWGRA